MPAIAITKNIPVWPDSPKRSSTTAEMMMVSIVMPETGFRAVVAMALAATDAKKNEKISVSARPAAMIDSEPARLPKKTPTTTALIATPSRMVMIGMSRSVRANDSSPLPDRNALNAIENDPTTTRSDLMMPKMPAVAMAPTPMKRT